MLVIFKSKAGADIIMFEENARQILDIFGKDLEKGIITAEETEQAIIKLENQVAISKLMEAEEAQKEEEAKKEEEQRLEQLKQTNLAKYEAEMERIAETKKYRPKPEPKVSFAARSYPFLQLLKAAKKKGKDIYWGV